MKRIPLYGWTALCGAALLWLELLAFAGLPSLGLAGRHAMAQARREQPLTHTYVVVGRYMVEAAPFLREPADAVAHACWDVAVPIMVRQNATAADRLFDSGTGLTYGLVKFGFWAAPLLLVLAMLGRLRKPRPLHVVGPGVRRR